MGIYNSSGTRVLNTGSGSVTTTVGLKQLAPVQTGSARYLEAGQYYVAVTWNSATGVIGGAAMGMTGMLEKSGVLTTGGGSVLPSSITPSSITENQYIYGMSINE
jgi:hypothetical protein